MLDVNWEPEEKRVRDEFYKEERRRVRNDAGDAKRAVEADGRWAGFHPHFRFPWGR